MGNECVHVVRTGDHLEQLASRYGFDANEVWNNPKHDGLRKQGRTAHLLCAGDLIYFPEPKRKWLPLEVGKVNNFTVKTPNITVSVAFKGDKLANAKCVVHHLAPPNTFTTDGNGKLSFSAPVNVSVFDVEFPAVGYHQRLQVGHLDPPTERSGQVQRLQNLGYLPKGSDKGDAFTAAVERYQRDHSLTVTGEVDDATRGHLEGAYGC
jgi:hypothetical protein